MDVILLKFTDKVEHVVNKEHLVFSNQDLAEVVVQRFNFFVEELDGFCDRSQRKIAGLLNIYEVV